MSSPEGVDTAEVARLHPLRTLHLYANGSTISVLDDKVNFLATSERIASTQFVTAQSCGSSQKQRSRLRRLDSFLDRQQNGLAELRLVDGSAMRLIEDVTARRGPSGVELDGLEKD